MRPKKTIYAAIAFAAMAAVFFSLLYTGKAHILWPFLKKSPAYTAEDNARIERIMHERGKDD